MKLANCNTMSVNISGWAVLELRKEEFDFSCLDEVMDRSADNGGKILYQPEIFPYRVRCIAVIKLMGVSST